MIDCEFMSCMGDDDLVVDAARVSFNKQAGNYSDSRNDSLINFLAREKHYAPFSHPHATFRCKAPIFVARQLAKHQVGGTSHMMTSRTSTMMLGEMDAKVLLRSGQRVSGMAS